MAAAAALALGGLGMVDPSRTISPEPAPFVPPANGRRNYRSGGKRYHGETLEKKKAQRFARRAERRGRKS
jgi:hypothetical protein